MRYTDDDDGDDDDDGEEKREASSKLRLPLCMDVNTCCPDKFTLGCLPSCPWCC